MIFNITFGKQLLRTTGGKKRMNNFLCKSSLFTLPSFTLLYKWGGMWAWCQPITSPWSWNGCADWPVGFESEQRQLVSTFPSREERLTVDTSINRPTVSHHRPAGRHMLLHLWLRLFRATFLWDYILIQKSTQAQKVVGVILSESGIYKPL